MNNNTRKPISAKELKELEKVLDRLFSELGIDVEFTKHFHDRVNDPRNKKQITIEELVKIYKDIKAKHGKKLSKSSGEIEKIIKSISTSINIPVVIRYDRINKEVDLVAKTVMRKKGFKNKDPELKVESFLAYIKQDEK